MESVLPGEQWVTSLKGIVHEPKLVVFNDETNKKIIVEEGKEIEFSFTDKIAIFIPDGHTGGYVANKGYVLLNGYGNYNSSGILLTHNIPYVIFTTKHIFQVIKSKSIILFV